MNEHQNVNKENKAPQRITWHILWSKPPQSVSRLNNYVTVNIQSKVFFQHTLVNSCVDQYLHVYIVVNWICFEKILLHI